MSDETESFETVIQQRVQTQSHEPTFYTTTNAEATGYNRPDREGYVMRGGSPIRVKHPQAGHQGDYDSPIRMKAEGNRYLTVVNSQGNVVYYVLTNGAGDMNPNSEYAVDRKQKARFFGWYQIGQCPVALLASGEMHRGHFVDRSLLKAHPCQPGSYSINKPCIHALAERKARLDKQAAYVAETEKQHANKEAEAQREQTKALTEAMAAQTKAIVGTLSDALGTKPEDSEPPKSKRG